MITLFTVTLVVELIFALGFILAPGMLFGTFGVTPSPFASSLARLFGSALLGFVVLLWQGRSSANPELHRAVLFTMFTYWLVSSVLLVWAQLSGLFNIMGWGTVAMHIGFLIAYGVFILKK
jgi:hypothetical protein